MNAIPSRLVKFIDAFQYKTMLYLEAGPLLKQPEFYELSGLLTHQDYEKPQQEYL